MLLRESEYVEKGDYAMLLELARSARNKDEHGYRIEFINMVESCRLLAQK
jgi:Ca-activated chloride channel homolog